MSRVAGEVSLAQLASRINVITKRGIASAADIEASSPDSIERSSTRLGGAARSLGVSNATDHCAQAIRLKLLDIELTNSLGVEQETALVVLLHVASYIGVDWG